MKNFVLKVDLSNFFSDERQKVLLMFNPQWKMVECLQKRVETLFNLADVRFLSEDNCFIPPQESIEVLKFCPNLKAFVRTDATLKKKNKNKRRNEQPSICETKEYDESAIDRSNIAGLKEEIGKRKYRSLDSGFTSSTPNKAKRRKDDNLHRNSTLVHHHTEKKSVEISSTSDQMPVVVLPSVVSSRNLVEKVMEESKHVSCNWELIPANQTDSTVVVKEVNGNTTALDSSTLAASLSVISNGKNNKKKKHISNMKNPFKDSKSNKQHIFYDVGGEISTTTSEKTSVSLDKEDAMEEKEKVLFHCSLDSMEAWKARVFHIKQPCMLKSKASKNIEIQENILLNKLDLEAILCKSSENKHSQLQDPVKDRDSGEIEDRSCLDEEKEDIMNKSNIKNEITGQSKLLNDSTRKSGPEILKKNSDTGLQSKSSEKLNGDKSCNLITSPANGHDSSLKQITQERVNKNNEVKELNDESSIASVDCVDLSIDVDDDDEPNMKSKSKKSLKSSHDTSNYDSSDVEEVIDLNESEEFGSKLKTPAIKLSNIMPFCIKLTQLPEMGDIIVFKLPYQTGRGSYSTTNFIAGETQYVHNRSKTIKLYVLDGQCELHKVPAKFITTLDDSFRRDLLQVKLSDLIEAKKFIQN